MVLGSTLAPIKAAPPRVFNASTIRRSCFLSFAWRWQCRDGLLKKEPTAIQASSCLYVHESPFWHLPSCQYLHILVL